MACDTKMARLLRWYATGRKGRPIGAREETAMEIQLAGRCGRDWFRDDPDDPAKTSSSTDSDKSPPLQAPTPAGARAPEAILPIGRLSPSPGLIVDRTGRSIVI